MAQEGPRRLAGQLGWFVFIWILSVAALGAIAWAIRLVLA